MPHVNTVRARLADGSVRTYYYHRRTKKRINAEPDTEAWAGAYALAATPDDKLGTDTLAGIILAYKRSPKFAKKLRDRTKRDYEKHLYAIATKFGTMTADVLNHPDVRRKFLTFRDERAETSLRQADYLWSVLRKLLQWAVDEGHLQANHARGGGRLYNADRSEKIWSDDQINAFLREAHETVRLAFKLALHTGQRQGDLIRLSWNGYNGQSIQLKQSKGGRNVYIPCTAELRALLENTPRKATTIMTNQRGLPWTEDGFRTMFDKTKRAAGIKDRTFHDLRGTVVTRLFESGCSEGEIASITGHTMSDVSNILDRYTARTKRLAESAIAKLEKRKT